jgi:hypothetical protein
VFPEVKLNTMYIINKGDDYAQKELEMKRVERHSELFLIGVLALLKGTSQTQINRGEILGNGTRRAIDRLV